MSVKVTRAPFFLSFAIEPFYPTPEFWPEDAAVPPPAEHQNEIRLCPAAN